MANLKKLNEECVRCGLSFNGANCPRCKDKEPPSLQISNAKTCVRCGLEFAGHYCPRCKYGYKKFTTKILEMKITPTMVKWFFIIIFTLSFMLYFFNLLLKAFEFSSKTAR